MIVTVSGALAASPLEAIADAAIGLGLQRTRELTMTGFHTDSGYDAGFLLGVQRDGKAISLTSLTTGTQYGFMMVPDTIRADRAHVVLGIMQGSVMDEANRRRMTLLRGERGQIIAVPGWR